MSSLLLIPPPRWVRELAFLHTGCNTRKSEPCTSPKQKNKANPLGRVVGELAPKLYTWESCLHYSFTHVKGETLGPALEPES